MMKKQYNTPMIDVRRYEITEMLSKSATDDGEFDLSELDPTAN